MVTTLVAMVTTVSREGRFYSSGVDLQKEIYRTVRSHRSAALNHTTAPPPRLSTYSKLRAAFSRNTRRAWLGLDGVSS